MSKNPWFGNNGDLVMTRGAQAIHEQLVANEGFDPNSDEYYGEIDKRMRVEFPHKFQEKRQNAQAVANISVTSKGATPAQGAFLVVLYLFFGMSFVPVLFIRSLSRRHNSLSGTPP